jgi:hypothetical protein
MLCAFYAHIYGLTSVNGRSASLFIIILLSQYTAIINILLITSPPKNCFQLLAPILQSSNAKDDVLNSLLKRFKSAGGFITLLSTRRPPLAVNLKAVVKKLSVYIKVDGGDLFLAIHFFVSYTVIILL